MRLLPIVNLLRPHCAGEIRKRKFHSENATNVYTTPEEFKNVNITGFVFEENSSREIK